MALEGTVHTWDVEAFGPEIDIFPRSFYEQPESSQSHSYLLLAKTQAISQSCQLKRGWDLGLFKNPDSNEWIRHHSSRPDLPLSDRVDALSNKGNQMTDDGG